MNHIPIKIRKAVQQRIAKQVTEVITGLLSDLLLVNFTSVIHASFGMLNALTDVKLDTSNQFVKVMFTLLQVLLTYSHTIDPVDSNDHILSLFATSLNSLHIQKRSDLSNEGFHDFVVDNSNVEPIIFQSLGQ